MELKCANLYKELLATRKEVKATNSLLEAVTKHGAPSSLAAHVTKMKDALREVV